MLRSSPSAAPALRRHTIGGVLVGCLVAVALLAPLPFRGRFFDGLTDALHSPLFATLACAALLAVRRGGRRSLAGELAVAGALIAGGAALEWLQTFSGRSPAWHDLVANVEGVCAGTLLLWGAAGLPSPGRLTLWWPRLADWPARAAAVAIAALLLAHGMRPGIGMAVEQLTRP